MMPARVRGLERARDVDEPADACARAGRSALADEAAERRADDVLHREVEPAVRLADVVDRDDVRMAERRDGARLAEEARRELAGDRGGSESPPSAGLAPLIGDDDDLERDRALEPRVEGPVDLAHAALTHEAADLVRSDEVSGLQHGGAARLRRVRVIARTSTGETASAAGSPDGCRKSASEPIAPWYPCDLPSSACLVSSRR